MTGDGAATPTRAGDPRIVPYADSPHSSSASSLTDTGHETPLTEVSEDTIPAPPKRRAPTPPAAIALAAASASAATHDDDPFDMAAIRHSLRYMVQKDAALQAQAKQKSQSLKNSTSTTSNHQPVHTTKTSRQAQTFGPQAPLTPPLSPNLHCEQTFAPRDENRRLEPTPPNSLDSAERPTPAAINAAAFEQPARYSPHLTVDKKAHSSKRRAMIDVCAENARHGSSQQLERTSIESTRNETGRGSPLTRCAKKRKTSQSGSFARTISGPILTPARHATIERAEAGLSARHKRPSRNTRTHGWDIDQEKMMLPVLPLHESRLVSAKTVPLRAAPSPCYSTATTPRASEAEPTSVWDSDDDEDAEDETFNLVSRFKSSLHIAERSGGRREKATARRPQRHSGVFRRMMEGRMLCSSPMG